MTAARRERVFDAFQFGDSHETELLLTKLEIESPLVEGWVIVENTFTHKGTRKDVYLEKILTEDVRFTPFRDRITVVSLDRNFTQDFRSSLRHRAKLAGKLLLPTYDNEAARTHYRDRRHLYAERCQRNSALGPLFEISEGEGWVVVSDTDEFLDCSTPTRVDSIVKTLRHGAYATRFRRQRFNYDIDNLCPAVRFVGCVSIAYLRAQQIGLQAIRVAQDGLITTLDPLVFEFSFCFPREAIERKLATFRHTMPTSSSLDLALECNHGLFPKAPTHIDTDQWYERVDLEAIGAPTHIIDNAEQLRTGNVNADYANARRKRYPNLFSVNP